MPKRKITCDSGVSENCEKTFWHYTGSTINNLKKTCDRCLQKKHKEKSKERYYKRKEERNEKRRNGEKS